MIRAVGDRALGSGRERIRSRTGIPKAKVFPEPVLALPMRSWPCIIRGIARDWIAVGAMKPRDLRAWRVEFERAIFDHAGRWTFSSRACRFTKGFESGVSWPSSSGISALSCLSDKLGIPDHSSSFSPFG